MEEQTNKYLFTLRKGSKKEFCPDCKRKSFKPYIWTDTNEIISQNLGFCDHINSCGHNDKAEVVWLYINSGNIDNSHKEVEVKDLPIYTIPTDIVNRFSNNPLIDNLTKGIRAKFSKRADEVFTEYLIINTGAEIFHRNETRKGNNENEANIEYKERNFDGFTGFVYFDAKDNCRSVKLMQYSPDLHRKKYKNGNGVVTWLHRWNDATESTLINEDKNEFKECYFGENLLKNKSCYKYVGIVESEKTALIGRICCPDTLFIAVGGLAKVNYQKFADLGLQKSKVIFYPDAPKETDTEPKNNVKTWADFVETWQKLAPNWKLSKVATDNLKDGQDIADLLLIDNTFADKLNNEVEALFSDAPNTTQGNNETETEEETETEAKSTGKSKKEEPFKKAWDWLSQRYDLRFDTLQQVAQFKLKSFNDWETLTDENESAFYSMLIDAYCKVKKTDIYELFKHYKVRRVHPIKDYFNSLQPYNPDTETDYITQLFANIDDIKNDAFKLLLCKKYFVGIVKTIFDNRFAPQMMLVFRGVRRSGKTTFVRYLCPDALREKYFCETPPDNTKDLHIACTENIMLFFDEIDQYSKRDINTMKALITLLFVKERRQYNKHTPSLKKIASLIGACNDAQFLRDITGDRKYLVIEANSINYRGYHEIKIEDCYRQAMYLMKTDFVCEPTAEETAKIVSENEQYRIKDTEEQLISRYFESPTEAEIDNLKRYPDKQIQRLKAVDVYEFLIWGQIGLKISQNVVSKVLSNKFTLKHTNNGNYYFVKCRAQYWQRFENFLKEKRLNGFCADGETLNPDTTNETLNPDEIPNPNINVFDVFHN